MKKFLMICVVLFLGVNSLGAKEIYIHVSSFKNETTMFNLSNELHEYGYEMYTTQYKSIYKVYTGPFKSMDEAQKSLGVIQKKIAVDATIVSLDIDRQRDSLVSKELKVPKKIYVAPVKKIEDVPEVKEMKKDYDNLYRETRFFIALSAGISKFDLKEEYTPSEIVLDNQPKDAGFTYGVELGYYFNNDFFATLNYQRTDLENVHFDNIFASLNYKFTYFDVISPYIGIIGGYNIMTWDNFPLTTTVAYENSSSFFAGLQVGNDIPLSEYVSAYIFYRYLQLDNTTKIVVAPSKGTIEHKSEQNFNLGLKINF